MVIRGKIFIQEGVKMPFVSQRKDTLERVCILDYPSADQVRLLFPRNILECPFCNSPMVPVGGRRRTHHFRHQAQCSHPDARGESVDHLLGKQWLYTQLLKSNNLTQVQIKLEYYFKDAGEHGRIADIAKIFTETGYSVAYELQLSQIPIDLLEARHQDYLNAGIEDVWYFGPKMQNPTIRAWADQNLSFGYVPITIDYQDSAPAVLSVA